MKGFPFLFNGICLVIMGVISIVFRDKFALWASEYRRRLADKYPAWKKISGLPDEKVEYYLSVGFCRKMVIVSAVILIIVGIFLFIVGVIIDG